MHKSTVFAATQRFQLCVAVVVLAHVREPYLWILGLNRELNLFSLSKAVQQDPVSTSSQINRKYSNTCAGLCPTPTQDCQEHKRTPSENGPVLEEKGDRKKVTESNSGSSSPRSLRTYGRYVISAKNTRTEHEDSHTNAHGGTCWRVTEQTACTKQFRDHGGPYFSVHLGQKHSRRDVRGCSHARKQTKTLANEKKTNILSPTAVVSSPSLLLLECLLRSRVNKGNQKIRISHATGCRDTVHRCWKYVTFRQQLMKTVAVTYVHKCIC